MIDLRPVGYVIGLLVAALGVTMLVPMTVDFAAGDDNGWAFLESAIVTIFFGGLLALACANGVGKSLTIQQAFLLTTGVWAVAPAFGALPFILGAPQVRLVDAYFEAMSGVTTTGSTVLVGLDDLPMGTNLWRGVLQWLGGLGIIIVAMLFLPVMKVGGMQFFRSEGFDTLGKVLPRALDISAALLRIYIAMTLIFAIVYYALGMSGFDAIVHSLTTISTGGFSTRDFSFAEFQGAPEYAATLFMVLASVPFIRFVQLMQGHGRPLFVDVQVRAYVRWILYASGAIAVFLVAGGAAIEPTLRESLFNVVSTFSGTGYTSTDVTLWGSFPFVILLLVGAIGGCTASTGCSIKVFRYLVLFEAIKSQIRQMYSPNMVTIPTLEGRRIEPDVINSVILLFSLFILSFGTLSVLLAMTGLEMRTAITASWTSVFNIGPAFGPEVGPTGAMNAFPDSAKWLMSFGMLIGRLEMVSVLVIFTARFWRA
ncbi:TrkH family potassium uptake protein [Palleronia sp. KMU-117]|uniref:TrkH family potassium uptake protein n=1 Tax=Palleronia sp. KMU-117 TaxID=3434108 RepID=UPI003D756BD3